MDNTAVVAGSGNVTFVQIWRVISEDDQRRLLQTMHSHVGHLTKQPGFVSMTLHASLDGKQTATYAHWVDEDSFKQAISSPEAKQGHDEMARWGKAEGALYRIDAAYLPNATPKL